MAYRKPVSFELGEREVDSRDSAMYWLGFLRSIAETIAAGVVSPDDLKRVPVARRRSCPTTSSASTTTTSRAPSLGELDQAAGIVAEGAPRFHLSDASRLPKYADFLQSIVQSDVYTQRERFRSILRVVRGSTIDATDTPLLRNLVERLALLETPLGEAAANTEAEVRLKVADQEFVFDTKKWREMIRNSELSAQMGRFMRYGEERSVFFTTDMDSDLRPIVWNPTNDGSSIFVGRATIEGRYTRAAFDKHVREVVKKLDGALAGANVPDAQKKQLNDFVRDQVRRYATEYRAQVVRFYQAFALRTPSQEALRVALSQMVSDTSSFNDFLVAVDTNTHLETDSPLLQPMSDALADFGSFHNVVNATSGAPELSKYRAILGQLLADLGPSDTGGVAAPPRPLPERMPDTLEKELTPARGGVVLANLRGEKGSYASLVGQWLQSIKLPEDQQRPFLAPLGPAHRPRARRPAAGHPARLVQRRAPGRAADRRAVPVQPGLEGTIVDSCATSSVISSYPQTGRFFDLFPALHRAGVRVPGRRVVPRAAVDRRSAQAACGDVSGHQQRRRAVRPPLGSRPAEADAASTFPRRVTVPLRARDRPARGRHAHLSQRRRHLRLRLQPEARAHDGPPRLDQGDELAGRRSAHRPRHEGECLPRADRRRRVVLELPPPR